MFEFDTINKINICTRLFYCNNKNIIITFYQYENLYQLSNSYTLKPILSSPN